MNKILLKPNFAQHFVLDASTYRVLLIIIHSYHTYFFEKKKVLRRLVLVVILELRFYTHV